MTFKKLRDCALVAGLGLAEIIGASSAKAAEPEKPARIEQKAQENPQTPQPAKTESLAYTSPLEWLIVGSEVAASVFATAAIHETGHLIAAKTVGVKILDFHPYPGKIGDTWVVGYINSDEESYLKQSKPEKITMDGAGMLATRLTGEGLDTLMNHADIHPRVKQGLAALYFMNRFEATKYIIRCAIPSWLGKPENAIFDPQSIVNRITNKTPEEIANNKSTKKEKIAYAIAVSALVMDTLMDWHEIKTNFDRLWLIDSKNEEQKNHDIGLDLLNGGVHASYTYKF